MTFHICEAGGSAPPRSPVMVSSRPPPPRPLRPSSSGDQGVAGADKKQERGPIQQSVLVRGIRKMLPNHPSKFSTPKTFSVFIVIFKIFQTCCAAFFPSTASSGKLPEGPNPPPALFLLFPDRGAATSASRPPDGGSEGCHSWAPRTRLRPMQFGYVSGLWYATQPPHPHPRWQQLFFQRSTISKPKCIH